MMFRAGAVIFNKGQTVRGKERNSNDEAKRREDEEKRDKLRRRVKGDD